MFCYIPHIITFSRVILFFPFLLLIVFSNSTNMAFVIFFIYLLISLTDFFDGFIARKLNLVSNFGKVLDPVVDSFINTSSILILSLYVLKIQIFIPLILIFRDYMLMLIRIHFANNNILIQSRTSGKFKTFITMISINASLFLNFLSKTGAVNRQLFIDLSYYMFIGSMLITWVAAFEYLIYAKSKLNDVLK